MKKNANKKKGVGYKKNRHKKTFVVRFDNRLDQCLQHYQHKLILPTSLGSQSNEYSRREVNSEDFS